MESNWEIWKNTEMMNLALAAEGDRGEREKGEKGEKVPTMQMLDDEHATLSLIALLADLVVLHVGYDVDVYSKELPKYCFFIYSLSFSLCGYLLASFPDRDVKLPQRSLSFYYNRLSGYVSDVFVTKPSAVSIATFTIYGKLLELHKKFEAYFEK